MTFLHIITPFFPLQLCNLVLLPGVAEGTTVRKVTHCLLSLKSITNLTCPGTLGWEPPDFMIVLLSLMFYIFGYTLFSLMWKVRPCGVVICRRSQGLLLAKAGLESEFLTFFFGHLNIICCCNCL